MSCFTESLESWNSTQYSLQNRAWDPWIMEWTNSIIIIALVALVLGFHVGGYPTIFSQIFGAPENIRNVIVRLPYPRSAYEHGHETFLALSADDKYTYIQKNCFFSNYFSVYLFITFILLYFTWYWVWLLYIVILVYFFIVSAWLYMFFRDLSYQSERTFRRYLHVQTLISKVLNLTYSFL